MVKINFPDFRNTFFRFQITALFATAVDFFMTILLKEKFQWYYTLAVCGGASAGAMTAFMLNRFWVFQAYQSRAIHQGIRYIFVAIGSIALNTSGTYIFTEWFNCPYLISKAVVAVIIGFTYSYYFSRRFVFYV